ncbi:DUF4212 domain-containing protein [Thalassotalea mangrovi]|uniref:DUF4212 domain-containing protein n=1 Tax=Thalassotalea mangrovi TaxID=2572245 RepID=A0A4V5NUH1_9GAMM|nr:DUF4212 domain-containing protein [Thalassotalea mangrovi]TKB46379.1 DUF4212 domain-containing protein [Thalassotalea mangrovi]
MNQQVKEQQGLNETQELANELYWRANLRLIGICLSIWFLVSFGCGILWVEPLNEIRLGGYKLGFWFAQQGSIYTFVILIFYYTRQMNKLDKMFAVKE